MEATINLQDNINGHFQPLYYNEYRILLMMGSAGSGKTVFGTQKKLLRAIVEGGHRFLITRKIARTIKSSIWSEFLHLITEWQLKDFMSVEVNRSDYIIKVGTSEFLFAGLDDPEKIKSIQGITGILIEEMTELDENDFDQLNLRLRGHTENYKQIIGLYNPISEDHWIKRRFYDRKQDNVYLHKSSYLENKFIDEEYKAILEGYKETNFLYWQIYCKGEWGVQDKSGKFLWAFDREKHITTGLTIDEKLPIRFSFDFNLEPFATAVYQRIDNDTIHILDEIRLNDSDIFAVCDVIKASYPGYHYIVTGDASGKSRSGTTRGKISYWQIIRNELALRNNQIRVRAKNLDLVNSRVLCNAVFKHKNILINDKCENIVSDCQYSKVDDTGVLVKDRGANKADFMDTARYLCDSEFPEILTKTHKRR